MEAYVLKRSKLELVKAKEHRELICPFLSIQSISSIQSIPSIIAVVKSEVQSNLQ
jgi:hypothetical protein